MKKLDSNNTKINNIKDKKIYLISDENEVFAYYNLNYRNKFRIDHPTMNKEKTVELITNFDKLSVELVIGEDYWFNTWIITLIIYPKRILELIKKGYHIIVEKTRFN